MSPAPGWTCRVASLADAYGVTAVLKASYPELWRPHYSPDVLDALLPIVTKANPNLLQSGRFHLAEADHGTIIGCGGSSAEWPGTDRCDLGICHVRHFAVHPSWTRRGIAAALLSQCQREARAAGFAAMYADSAYGAEAFYAAHGFVPIGPSQTVIAGVHLPGTLMHMAL